MPEFTQKAGYSVRISRFAIAKIIHFRAKSKLC